MIASHYEKMLQGKSVIRELSEFATARGKEIGYENVFDYSLGNPSVPVPEAVTETMIKLLREKNPMELHGYSPSLGIPSVREKVAKSLSQRFGIPYEAEHIFMTSGAAGAIAHALRAVTEPGDEVLTFAPCFSEYVPYVNGTGARLKVVPANTETFQINFEAFEEMLSEKTAAVLINTPNNPSGVVYSTATIQKLAEILTKKAGEYGREIYIISDEPYREILFEGVDAPCVAAHYGNTLMCYSFSKSLSFPGERIGYVAVGPACRDAVKIIQMCGQISRETGHNCPASLIQLAVAEHLDLTSDLSVYETNKNILYRELTQLGFTCTEPGGTFYIFPKALEEDAKIFCEKGRKYDLIMVPGDGFGCPGYFRMAYCIDTEKVERSLAALRRFVETEYPNRK
ncbi:MAG: pyridoxal phosphate-dependent aminotransferase [Lachnospiraceae bacterium]|nr:pyridoxal phosphate-dependent aminotransferase [Lachnospiraceae bacterium]